MKVARPGGSPPSGAEDGSSRGPRQGPARPSPARAPCHRHHPAACARAHAHQRSMSQRSMSSVMSTNGVSWVDGSVQAVAVSDVQPSPVTPKTAHGLRVRPSVTTADSRDPRSGVGGHRLRAARPGRRTAGRPRRHRGRRRREEPQRGRRSRASQRSRDCGPGPPGVGLQAERDAIVVAAHRPEQLAHLPARPSGSARTVLPSQVNVVGSGARGEARDVTGGAWWTTVGVGCRGRRRPSGPGSGPGASVGCGLGLAG